MPADERKQWIRNIKEMTEIIECGVEIHPSLTASKEKQSAIDSSIVTLANGAKELKALASPLGEYIIDTSDNNKTVNNSTDNK